MVESRWCEADTGKLYDHFRSGSADPENQSSEYIKAFYDKTPWLQQRTSLKKAYVNYRRKADEWMTERSKKGGRRATSKVAAKAATHANASGGGGDDAEDASDLTAVGLDEDADGDALSNMASLELGKSSPMTVSLPCEAIVYKDKNCYSYVRVRVFLLSGCTMDSTNISVDPTGWYLHLKYQLPQVWSSVHTVQQNESDLDWDASDTSLEYEFRMHLEKQKAKYDSQKVYAVQKIKLPMRCERQFSNAYGLKAFVKLYEHEDKDFRKNKQFYGVLHANLIAVEKPAEEHSSITFARAKNPAVEKIVVWDSPFEKLDEKMKDA